MICLNCKKPYVGSHSAFCDKCCADLPMILTDLKIERDKAQAAVARLRELLGTVYIGKYTLRAAGKRMSISRKDGESGDFPIKLLEGYLDTFWDVEF